MNRQAIRVWILPSDQDVGENICGLLDDAERVQYSRFVRPSDRNAASVTRAAVRCLLSSEICVPPQDIKLVSNLWGKPSLSEVHGRKDIDFSVSHTIGLSAIAISHSGATGIDVEQHRPVPDKSRIAASVFGDGVAGQLDKLPVDCQDNVFLRLWTAGEACVKATGLGFAGTGRHVPVRLSPGGIPEVGMLNPSSNAGGDGWSLVPLDLPSGYIGNVVLHSPNREQHLICVPEKTNLSRLASRAYY